MFKYKWHRRQLSLEEYKKNMGISEVSEHFSESKKDGKTTINVIHSNSDGNNYKIELPNDFLGTLNISKSTAAYNTASDFRKFEIDLFWKRALFFWGFITAIYTAYYQVLTKIYDMGKCNPPRFVHGTFPLFILSGLGLFFCFSWLLTSKGSKHWQENWEHHLELLEDNVTGPLYKTYVAGNAPSESKITIAAGWVVTACSYSLLIYEFVNMIKKKLNVNFTIQIMFSFLFAIAVALCLFVYSELMVGNSSDLGNYEFQIKEYEELDYE